MIVLLSCGSGGGGDGAAISTSNTVNNPPEMAVIGDRVIAEGEVLEFTVSATDPDNDHLTFNATQLPAGAKFENLSFFWQPAVGQAGMHQVLFEVSDDAAPPLVDAQIINIRVEPTSEHEAINHPPVMAVIGDKIVGEGQILAFTVLATDPDNDHLTFNATQLPAGAKFENQAFSWQPAVGQAGMHQVLFEVSDDGFPILTHSESITIRVEQSTNPPPAIEMVYGTTGPYTVEVESFVNPAWQHGVPASVLLPVERTGPVPVLFFSHGLSATDWHSYSSLLTHLVSWGFAVVYAPYPVLAEGMTERHQILWSGFKVATEKYESIINLHKVGFIGHSMGGGATPAMAWKALVEEGWGDQGAFLFIMAPWYSYEISDTQLTSFPGHLNLMIQVYDKDEICDHRMAIDIFEHISVPDSRKSYCNVPTGGHSVPAEREINHLDRYAVAEPLDALIDYTFEIDRPDQGKAYALDGQGEHYYHTITKTPVPVADESTYLSPWSSGLNPRFP